MADAMREALQGLVRAYVNTLESGRDRIIELGGDCDPVDVMERADPFLRAAREALAQQPAQGEAVGDGMTALYDLLEIGAAARDPTTLRINIENTIRRSRCLDAIEREIFAAEYDDTDPDIDGSYQDNPLSRAADPAEYVEQFRALLASEYPTAPPAPSVPDEWKRAMRQLVYSARTSGGTAGPDPLLMEACEACEKLIASGGKASVPDDVAKDAARFRWLTDDHADPETRVVVRSLCIGLRTRSSSGSRLDIDAAMLAAATEVPRG